LSKASLTAAAFFFPIFSIFSKSSAGALTIFLIDLKCFSKFDDKRQLTGGRIITWKVDFDCKQKNNVYFVEPVVEEPVSVIEEVKTGAE